MSSRLQLHACDLAAAAALRTTGAAAANSDTFATTTTRLKTPASASCAGIVFFLPCLYGTAGQATGCAGEGAYAGHGRQIVAAQRTAGLVVVQATDRSYGIYGL